MPVACCLLPKAEGEKTVAVNRKAGHDYEFLERYEAGIALTGTEVKSIRDGRVNLRDAFARVQNGELWLHNMHIAEYPAASQFNHEPTRPRKLLAHRREIKKLEEATTTKGTTIIPLAIYFKDGRAKVEIGVAKGKQQFDKRQSIKKKEMDRDLRKAMSHRR